MNRKSFLILLILLIVVGGVGLYLFNRDSGSWKGAKAGARPFQKLNVNDVGQIHLQDAHAQTTLINHDGAWTVKERGNAKANFETVRNLLIKLPEVKVVQTQTVEASLLPRLNLAEPGAEVKAGGDAKTSSDAKSTADAGANSGTQLELQDKNGKPMASLLLGKPVIKTEDSPLAVKPTSVVGRYVLLSGDPSVLLISDGLTDAQADPAHWLAPVAPPAPAPAAASAPVGSAAPGSAGSAAPGSAGSAAPGSAASVPAAPAAAPSASAPSASTPSASAPATAAGTQSSETKTQ